MSVNSNRGSLYARVPKASSEGVARSMRSNKSSGTKPELNLAKLLRKKLLVSRLPGRPDFVYSRAKLAIFVQGCWWHGCRVCKIPLPRTHSYYWRKKLERNMERDKLNFAKLESDGWKAVEVWEHELKKDPTAVVSKVKRIVSARTRLPNRAKQPIAPALQNRSGTSMVFVPSRSS